MRRIVDRERLLRFMDDIGRAARTDATVYLTGGASALLYGWRATTIDIDLKIDPETNEILRTLPALKERFDLNIELASPDHFIPPLPGWRERSPFIERCGHITFRHYDFYSQALAKLECGHARDTADVDSMLATGLVARSIRAPAPQSAGFVVSPCGLLPPPGAQVSEPFDDAHMCVRAREGAN